MFCPDVKALAALQQYAQR